MLPPDETEHFPCAPEPGSTTGTQGKGQHRDKSILASRPGAEQPRRRRQPGPPPEYVKHPGFPPVRMPTVTELREGLDEDMERACWRSGPIDRTDMMSFADRLATLGEREKESEQ